MSLSICGLRRKQSLVVARCDHKTGAGWSDIGYSNPSLAGIQGGKGLIDNGIKAWILFIVFVSLFSDSVPTMTSTL